MITTAAFAHRSTLLKPTPPATWARHTPEQRDSRLNASLRSEWINLTTVTTVRTDP